MGYHILLHVRARIKPEFMAFIENMEYFMMEGEVENELPDEIDPYDENIEYYVPNPELPDAFREVHALWKRWSNDWGFRKYIFDEDTRVWSFTISNRAYNLSYNAYDHFMKNFVVYVTEHIEWCEIEHDDYGDMRYQYTDADFRSVEHRTEHVQERATGTSLQEQIDELMKRVRRLEQMLLTASAHPPEP